MKTKARDRKAMTKNEKMRIGFTSFVFIIILIFGLGDCFAENLKKELLIKVKNKIIALPGNSVSVVPINVARIRSSDLRELNSELRAVRIERLYRLESDASDRGLKIKGLRSEKINTKPEPVVDLTKMFTSDVKKQQIKDGKNVTQALDTFILHFDLEGDVNMDIIAERYLALDVVIYAQHIIRKK